MTKRVMEDFSISEISAVDRPAQKGARMTIMKRDDGEPYWKRSFTAEQREQAASSGAAMPDGSFPIISAGDLKNAIHATGRADSPEAAKKHIISRAKALGHTDLLPDGWVSKSAGDGKNPDHGENHMDPKELEKKIADAVAAATADLSKKLETSEAIIKMSKEEREHLDAMKDDEAKKEFMAMSPEDRKKKVSKAAESDEVLKVDGNEIRKSAVGDATFAVLKSQQAAIAKQADDLKKAKDETEFERLKKRATDEFGHLPGTPEAKASILKAMGSMDEGVRKNLDHLLKTAEKIASSAFVMKGSLDGTTHDAESPEGKLDKRAKEIQKADSVSYAKAYDKAATENPALYDEISKRAAAAQ
ncbi:hypothetical protein GCM10011491_30880 [Brucella endophytica]|uniref:Uncharacterized protein n=1 Tax=Brucella endophytica TaxID=1963359 RepID=A0A916SHL6_9HYPH|nr:hypothetical protein [Brucella endophytica]GGB00502.1 hypothetical protein GCM10011491_30880 [Brucella endophytica]